MKLPLNIEEYLRGYFMVDIPDATLASVLFKRGIPLDNPASIVEQKTLDLCLADLYIFMSTAPSVKNNTEDSDGGWKHTEGGYQIAVADKRAYRSLAKRLYEKWGEKMPLNSIVIRQW